MTKREITFEEAKLRLSYVPETGRIVRTKRVTSGRSGEPIGRVCERGHRIASFLGRNIATAKLVWLLHKGAFPPGNLRRINGDPSDDRIENLGLLKREVPCCVLSTSGCVLEDAPSTPGIYAIACVGNGRRYVGSAVNFEKRWKLHIAQLDAEKHGNRHMQRAWLKYGKAAFVFQILEHVSDVKDLICREQFHIDAIGPEFNICRVANSKQGVTATPETRAKLSAAHVGRPSAKRGIPLSADTKRKISETKTGVKLGPYGEARKEAVAKAMRAGKNALTEAEVRAIREMDARGVKCPEISKILNRGYYSIHDVLRGRTFTWVN